MASVNSPLRSFLKPLFFKLIGNKGYARMQFHAKKKDIEQKLLEEPEMELLPSLLSASDNCIDIGANYAYYSHRLSFLCPKGQVYAFEPIPFTFKIAERIVKSFGLKNVSIYQLGVGNENSTVTFEVPLQSFGAYSAGQAHISGRDNELKGKEQHYQFASHEKVSCRIVRLDDFKEINKKIAFVKIDIEGAELFALRGMKQLLLRDQPIVLLEINPFFLEGFHIREQELRDFFAETGYSIFMYDAASKKLKSWNTDFIESNYILLPSAKPDQYKNFIA
jgi:FkbM family methyltransferase